MTVQYSGDNGAILFLPQKAVLKINGQKTCETATVPSCTSLAGTTFSHSLNMALVFDSAF